MKKEIFDSQKKIYNYMRRKALSYEHYYSPEIQSYQENYESYSTRPFKNSSLEDLYQAVFTSDIIYLGDFHTFDQNLKNFIRLANNCITNNVPLCFALEMLFPEHKKYVDAYFEGDITELEFLESIQYHDSWRFPWTHYKKIFDFAKKHAIPIVGLNSKGKIEKRDERAAHYIVQTKKKYPNLHVFVFFGEYHIVPNKLPNFVSKKLKSEKSKNYKSSKSIKIDQLIIHQNLENPYWKIVNNHKGLKQYKILKFNPNEYCIISSPPWMKYESMCYWYENLMDDPDYDIHEYIIENGLKIFTGTTAENFLLLCKHLSTNFHLKIPEKDLNFNVYDHSSLDFIENEINKNFDGHLKQFFHYL
ncbi:MAG: ChaN family lipoprotein, partial [Bacteriovoracaceae bacterium]|nr:ChaN family lipoprotein [Bacteriovoracaceae bacterium]